VERADSSRRNGTNELNLLREDVTTVRLVMQCLYEHHRLVSTSDMDAFSDDSWSKLYLFGVKYNVACIQERADTYLEQRMLSQTLNSDASFLKAVVEFHRQHHASCMLPVCKRLVGVFRRCLPRSNFETWSSLKSPTLAVTLATLLNRQMLTNATPGACSETEDVQRNQRACE